MSRRPPHAITLDVPHASRPTESTRVQRYRISRGPRRTFSRLWPGDPEETLYVPPVRTWTLETLQLLWREVAAFIPPGDVEPEDCALFVYINREGCFHPLTADFQLRPDDRLQIDVETRRAGAGIDVDALDLTAPMRAALAALAPIAGPGTSGMPIAAIEKAVN
jgi:hypothetical protein